MEMKKETEREGGEERESDKRMQRKSDEEIVEIKRDGEGKKVRKRKER